MGEKRLKCAVYESTLSTADAVPLPQGGRLRGTALCADFCKGRCPKAVRRHQPLETTHPCFQTMGFNGFKRFNGFRWRLRRILDDVFPYRQPSPQGEGAPKGRIGHWRYEREWEGASQVRCLRKHPSAAPRRFYKGRCPKAVRRHLPFKTTHPCFQTTGFKGFKRF